MSPEHDTATLRQRLHALDDPSLDAFCLDHYPAVYNEFARGLRKGEKITLLLDRCRHQPDGLERLASLLDTWPLSPPPPPRRLVPLQRPPRAEHFTGREQELTQLLNDLQPGRVVTLCGPGGIGKTALAAEAIWTLAPGDEPSVRFPDGIITHSFYNQPPADLALEAIARVYGEEPRPTPRDAAQRALAGRTALLLLDGTEQADNLQAVLEVRGSCGVLATTRKRQDAVAERCDVVPLPTAEAVDLLRAWGREQAADETAAQRICELVGRLPLAVRLVGRYLDRTRETAAEYLDWLTETPLPALDHGQRRQESVPVLLDRSLDQVGAGAREALGVGAL